MPERGSGATTAIGWLGPHLRLLGPATALAAGLVVGYLIWAGNAKDTPAGVSSDTPPAEFLYLDNVRVRAYLGQALGGLSDSQKRTLSSSSSVEAKVNAGPLGEAGGSRGRQASVEETVTPQTTDLFLTLLNSLRTGGHGRGDWLKAFPVRTRVASRTPVTRWLNRVNEGDFVRLTQAHLFLAPFAALVPRARPAAPFEDGRFKRRTDGRAAATPSDASIPVQADVDAYVADVVDEDPQLPFVVPILNLKGQAIATILIPARYSALLDNTRLLAGNLTVVGKVEYIERRFADDPHCDEPTRAPCIYVDRETALAFGPALEKARPSVRDALGLTGRSPTTVVTDSVTFHGPLVVLLPLAIYQ